MEICEYLLIFLFLISRRLPYRPKFKKIKISLCRPLHSLQCRILSLQTSLHCCSAEHCHYIPLYLFTLLQCRALSLQTSLQNIFNTYISIPMYYYTEYFYCRPLHNAVVQNEAEVVDRLISFIVFADLFTLL